MDEHDTSHVLDTIEPQSVTGITALLNAEAGYQIGERSRVSAEFLNLFNRRDHDIDYAYTSRISPTAASAFTDVFHPVEPFQVRGLRGTF